MNKNFVLFGILASILMGGSFGSFLIVDSFADDVTSDKIKDSKANKKLEEKQDKQKQKEDERKEKQLEKQDKQKQKEDERKEKLEQKKVKLDSNRKKLEEKLIEKANKYKEKLREIKEKYQNKIESDLSGDVEKFSSTTAKLEDKFNKKSDEIRKKLLEKQEKLDSRTKKILEKINNGDYLGDKIGTSNTIETYQLVFDSVTATEIDDKTQQSLVKGSMTFSTFDKGESNLKLELKECQITVGEIPFNCGFGKARTISGDSESNDSLVIIAFLEDVLEEVHPTLKISLNADSPIGDIDGTSKVSILGPPSQISGMWFLDGTGFLTRTVSTTDDSTENEIAVELTEDVGISGN